MEYYKAVPAWPGVKLQGGKPPWQTRPRSLAGESERVGAVKTIHHPSRVCIIGGKHLLIGGKHLFKHLIGLEPTDWKPFDEVGPGTKEIRYRDACGIYRVMYVAKFEEAIYVLHCFKKKTEATAKGDKEIAETRYRALVRERKAIK